MSGVSEAAAGIQPRERDIARRETLRQLARSKTLMVGVLIVGFWVACALFGSTIAPDDPLELTDVVLAPPSGAHWFGTDALGRDVFSRVIVGAGETLKIAPLATLLGIVLGTTIGLITGYFRGIVDESISRVIDAFLALPLIVLAVTALVGLGSSNATLIIVIGVAFTPIVARTVRATVLGERELDYVDAAKLRGERSGYIMFVEILPEHHGPDHRRGDCTAGLRDLRRRWPHLSRLRRSAPVAGLVVADRRQLSAPQLGHVLVDGAVRRARGLEPRRRCQPDRRRSPAGARPVRRS